MLFDRPLLRFLSGWFLLVGGMAHGETLEGPLRIHPQNPRYFTNDSGRVIVLTGSHTWNNLVDMGPTDPPRPFDYDAYLDWLTERQHNFFRLWTWELLSWDTEGNREQDAPGISLRLTPGSARAPVRQLMESQSST